MMRFLALILFVVFPYVASAQSIEICDNGVDDDGDGFVDCQDTDCSEPVFSDGSFGGNSNSVDVDLADFDSDGDLDVWITNSETQPNKLWLNDGNGSLSDSEVEYIGGGNASSVGDIDGDGDKDVFVARPGADRVWFNNGSGVFISSGQDIGDSASSEVELADFDFDGDLDAFTVGIYGAKVWVNNGLGFFSELNQTVQAFGYTRDVVVFDVDADGDIDAVLRDNVSTLVWLNDGTGVFSDTGQSLVYTTKLVHGDFDLDGDLDLMSGETVLLNDGNGLFSELNQAISGNDSYDISVGDLDGDGDLDAFVGNQVNNHVHLGYGTGFFAPNSHFHGDSQRSAGVALGDLDNDGDLDVVIANDDPQNNGSSSNRVKLNNGAGGFSDIGQASIQGRFGSCEFVDLNNDEMLDLALAGFDGAAFFLNQGGGAFAQVGSDLSDPGSVDICLGDLDGDDDIDSIVITSYVAEVLINDGFGEFTNSGQVLESINTFIHNVEAGDLNGDSFPDLFISGRDYSEIWFNDGLGVFTKSTQLIPGHYSKGLDLGDVDNDGDLDAFITSTNVFNNHNRLWINDGNGVFEDSGVILGVGDESSEVEFSDLDGDGDQDAVLIGDGYDYVFHNEAGLLYVAQILDSQRSKGLSLGDFDGDGDVDGIVTRIGQHASRIFVNDGAGHFYFTDQRIGSSSSSSVAVGDIDGDGDYDAYVPSAYPDNLNFVYINETFCAADPDGDGVAILCDVDSTLGDDCDSNGQDDSCQDDQDSDGIVDPCDDDIDGDGIPNSCDLDLGGDDCNLNGIADNCDIDLNSDEIPDDCQEPLFRRGDPNGDGAMDIGDGVTVLGYLFGSTSIACFDAGDSNDDGNLNIADAITILSALFTGGDSPPEPGPVSCDLDPTPDSLGCDSYENCS